MNDKNYTKGSFNSFSNKRQLVLPLDCEILLSKDSPVRLVDDMLERLDYTEQDRFYSSHGRKSKLSQRDMLKVIIYAMLEGIHVASSGADSSQPYGNRPLLQACARRGSGEPFRLDCPCHR